MLGPSARDMSRIGRVLCALAVALCLGMLWGSPRAARATQGQGAQEFVRVRGTQFFVGERPFRFVGANVSVIHGPNERASYERVLDAVAADGLKVVRLWALGEVTGPEKPHHPLYAFRIGETGWVDASFVHLDRVLAAARARDLRVIVVLANRWKDYGGIATYLAWAGFDVERDDAGEPLRPSLAAFFACQRCQDLYREHVARVVGRTNSLTGVAYRDDPTIMAWELINEASGVTAHEEESLLKWVRESARFVRSLDSHHLISAGHIGYSTSRERAVWRAVQSLEEVDFADAHAYPLGDPRIANTAHLAQYMDDPLALAQVEIKKPLVFGEFGFERKGPPRAYVQRLRWMRAFLHHAAQRGAAGALVWIYEPPENPRRRHTISADARDPSSRHVRQSLSTAATEFGASVQGIRVARWERPGNLPQFLERQVERGTFAPHRDFRELAGERVLDIDPMAFALSNFERTGGYDGGALESLWGAGEGFVEYRFTAPRGLPHALRVEARVSSELPGFGDGSDPRDGSDVQISVDGEALAIVRAKSDDGLGELVGAELHDARALRKIFAHASVHALRFRALASHYAGGLCIYGKPTGHVPLPAGAERSLSAIRISLAP